MGLWSDMDREVLVLKMTTCRGLIEDLRNRLGLGHSAWVTEGQPRVSEIEQEKKATKEPGQDKGSSRSRAAGAVVRGATKVASWAPDADLAVPHSDLSRLYRRAPGTINARVRSSLDCFEPAADSGREVRGVC